MSLQSLIAQRNPDAMPWRVGFDLGHFCGVENCRNRPAAYSQYCVGHTSPIARRAATRSLPAKTIK